LNTIYAKVAIKFQSVVSSVFVAELTLKTKLALKKGFLEEV